MAEVPDGTGVQFKSIAYVKAALDDSDNEQSVGDLYYAMFGKKSTQREMRETLYTFHGFTSGSTFENDLKTRLNGFTIDQLKGIHKLVNSKTSRSKGDYVTNILEVITTPADTKKTYKKKEKKEESKSNTNTNTNTNNNNNSNDSKNAHKMSLGEEDEDEEEDEDDDNNNNSNDDSSNNDNSSSDDDDDNNNNENNENNNNNNKEGEEKDGKKKRRTHRRSKKDEKDPDAPKKPRTAYILFQNDHREKIQQDLTEKLGHKPSVTEIATAVAERWRETSEEEKQPYKELYEKENARYQAELTAYRESGKEAQWKSTHPRMRRSSNNNDDDDEETGNKRTPKDPNAPKRSISGYLFFVTEKREQVVQELTNGEEKPKNTDILKRLAAMWKELPDEQKVPFNKKSEEDRQRYEKEYKEYEESGKKKEWEDHLAQLRKEKAKKNANKGKSSSSTQQKKGKRRAPVKLEKGVAPSEKQMRAWLEQYLERTSDDVQISLKLTRKDMEKECGVSLTNYKHVIERIVSEITQDEEDEE